MTSRYSVPPVTKSTTIPKSSSILRGTTCTTRKNSRSQTLWMKKMWIRKSFSHWPIRPGSFTHWWSLKSSSAKNWMRSITWISTSCSMRRWTEGKVTLRSSRSRLNLPNLLFKLSLKTPTFTTVSTIFSAPKMNSASMTSQKAIPFLPKRENSMTGKNSEVKKKGTTSRKNDWVCERNNRHQDWFNHFYTFIFRLVINLKTSWIRLCKLF